MLRTAVLLGLAAGLAQAPPAVAQTSPPPKAPPPQAGARTVEGVTVTAPTQDFRSSVDRRSYSVGKDIQASTGSVADVLRNIPSVDVDVQGNVSLRGDPNVTILVDGKPSGLFRPETRAQALSQFPAAQIDRIEVITNPSAAFDPEGSAGIINIVTKPVKKPGVAGSLRAAIGSREHNSTGLTLTYGGPKLSLHGDLSARMDPQPFHYDEVRIAGTGPSAQTSHDVRELNGRGHILSASGGFDFDAGPKDRLSAGLRRTIIQVYQQGSEAFTSTLGSAEPGPSFLNATFRSPSFYKDTELTGSWRRQFPGDGHALTISIRGDWNDAEFRRPELIIPLDPAGADTFEVMHIVQNLATRDLKADYVRPLSGGGKLSAGLEREADLNDYATLFARGPSEADVVTVPGLTGKFLFRQAITSGYVTYDRAHGPLEAQAGLRLEEVRIETAVDGAPLAHTNGYRRAYPSLHLAYDLGGGEKLSASYSRRVQRPRGFELSPLRTEADPVNFTSGNPNLRPQETDSFELGFERKAGSDYQLATVFYRRTRQTITDVVQDLGGGVLLTTRANAGMAQSAGFELVANGKLGSDFSYNVSGDLYWADLLASNLGFPGRRSGYSTSGRGTLTWQPTPDDTLQANVWLSGRQLTPQGLREGAAVLNLGYRRKLGQGLFATLTVQDAFSSFRQVIVVETPALRDRLERRVLPAVITLGVSYDFGGPGRKAKEPAFDFGGPPAS